MPLRRLFLCFFHPVGSAFYGVMHQPVDQGDHAGGIGEDFIPFAEGTVGGNDGGALFIASVDDFEQQVCMPVAVGQIADFVDDQ